MLRNEEGPGPAVLYSLKRSGVRECDRLRLEADELLRLWPLSLF
jgi:hypothetical protein